jgi:riboflavin transporter FmnP
MKKNAKKSMTAFIITAFLACIFTSINLLVFNYYYLRRVYNNVYTADGEWILSFDKLTGYFQDEIGLTLSLINMILILAVVIFYVAEEIKDKKYAKSVLKEIIDDKDQ